MNHFDLWEYLKKIERILGWASWTTNREYNKLSPYFQENAQIFTKKIE